MNGVCALGSCSGQAVEPPPQTGVSVPVSWCTREEPAQHCLVSHRAPLPKPGHVQGPRGKPRVAFKGAQLSPASALCGNPSPFSPPRSVHLGACLGARLCLWAHFHHLTSC